MQTIEVLRQTVEQALRGIDYPLQPDGLFEPIRYTLSSGGKRIRPVFLLAVFDWLRNARTELAPALPAACAVEVFHNFTLLHDDIMDRSDLRRGRPTVQARNGANVAILSGDAMCILAYGLLAKTHAEWLPGLLTRFNHLALGVCKGQQWDMEFERSSSVTLEEYLEMIQHKTADLIEGAVRMGCHMGGGDENVENLLASFARELGIAFQLQDDLLDTYGQTEIFGKECGDDIMDNKKTYLSILAWQKASADQRKALLAFAADATMPRIEKVNGVRAIFDALGVEKCAEQEIHSRRAAAEEYLVEAERYVGRKASVLHELFTSLAHRAY